MMLKKKRASSKVPARKTRWEKHDDEERAKLEEMLAKLKAENQALKSQVDLRLRVSPKGGVSVYGLGRWPVTLYMEQWLKLIQFAPNIEVFIERNKDRLSKKEK